MADSKVTRIEETFGTLKRRGSRPGSCPQRSMVLSHWRNCNLCSRRGKDIKQKTVILQGNGPYIFLSIMEDPPGDKRLAFWNKSETCNCLLDPTKMLTFTSGLQIKRPSWAQPHILTLQMWRAEGCGQSWRLYTQNSGSSQIVLFSRHPQPHPYDLNHSPVSKQSTHKNPCGRRFSTAGIKAMDPVKFIPELQERECVVYTWNYLYLCMWSKRP